MPQRDDWTMNGNAGTDPNTQFIGTTDSVDVIFKSNNAEALRITSNQHARFSSVLEVPQIGGGTFLFTDVNGTIQKGDLAELKSKVYEGDASDCFNQSFAPGSPQPTPTWTAEPGKIYTCPNVGIGTIDPLHALEVIGNVKSTSLVLSPVAGIIQQASPHRIYVDGTSVFNGRVSIGTDDCSHPDYMLAVNGKIIASEVKVKTPVNGCWPDYVFRKNYRLLPIPDLETFIHKNEHLPGVPSAEQIDKDGINASEMLMIQMKLIEDLTLYTIQLKKEIDELKKQVNK